MKLISQSTKILIPLLLPYTLLTGCSIVGLIVGGATHPALEGKITSPLGLDSIELGRQIRLIRFDRSPLEGSYRGLESYPGILYARTYDTLVARSAYRGFVPNLNQKITLRSAGRSIDGFFKGIDKGELLFQPGSGSDTIAVSLDELDWLQASDSLRLDGKRAMKLVRDGTMLGREVIALGRNDGQELVPYESIEIVEVIPSRSGALAGFLVGLGLDVTCVAVVASSFHPLDCSPQPGTCQR